MIVVGAILDLIGISAALVRLIGTREMEVAWVDDFSCLIYGATKKKIPIHICK